MSEFVEVLFSINTLTATLRLATPIVLGAAAGAISERAGIINLGLEGKILGGAFVGAYFSYVTGSPWIGLLAAGVAGALMGASLAVFAIRFRADHVVAGVGLNILMMGLTGLLMQVAWGSRGSSPSVPPLPHWEVPIIKNIPLVGPLLGNHTPIVFFMLVAVPLLWVWLFRTPSGLRVRMIGEHPEAADTVGIRVHRTQYLCMLLAGALAALGGAHLSLGHLSIFSANMSAGRGYMAIAANIFGQWNPLGGALSAMLFAFTDALQMRIQTLQIPWPTELIQMLPYALTIAVVAGAVRKSRAPAALGRHYQPGGRR